MHKYRLNVFSYLEMYRPQGRGIPVLPRRQGNVKGMSRPQQGDTSYD